MPLIACLVCSWIMPAIASAPPDGISTVVSARRTRIDGMVTFWVAPGTVSDSALSLDRSDTSVITLRLMRPSDSTTGVKFMLTPNFLNSIEAWQSGGDLVVSQLRPAGMGNWPPARNVALSPEIALSVGSASVRITPARSIALRITLVFCAYPNVPMKALPDSDWPNALNGLAVAKLTTEVPCP